MLLSRLSAIRELPRLLSRRGDRARQDETSAAASALERLVARLEGEFSALGDGLLHCFSDAADIAQRSARAPELLGGGEAGQAAESFGHILALAEDMRTSCGEASGLLGEVCGAASRLRKNMASRRQFISTFRVLQTMSRIEIARLDQNGADFGGLTEETSALAVRIAEETESIDGSSRQLAQSASDAATRARKIEAEEESAIPELISDAERSLDALLLERREAASASVSIAEGYKRVSAATEQLVSSMQFHDIARQQLEHAIEALRAGSAAESGGANAMLQAAHVRHACDELTVAVDRIASSLGEIVRSIDTIAGVAAALLAPDAEAGGGSWLDRVEQDSAKIIAALSHHDEAEREIAAAASSVLASIGATAGAVDRVQAIGFRMQLVALNSSIRSSHLGDRGASLSVLADLARTLAADSDSWAEAASSDLESISAHGAKLTALAGDRAVRFREHIQEKEREMRGALSALGDVERRGIDLLRGIQESAAALRQAIDLLSDRADLREALARLGGEAIQALERVAAADPSLSAGALPDAARRYTMQAEHDVHRAVLASESAPVEEQAAPDIELF